MRLLITGAAGMLGQDVRAAAEAAGHDVIARSRSELDITDLPKVLDAVGTARPDAVINCAAYTNVDGAESEPEAARRINGEAAGHVAAAAAKHGAWTLHVSSDYVFDGTKTTPYTEDDPTHPLSVYGSSKLAGEAAVAQAAPDSHTVVRSSWLFGAGGACFPATILRLAGERPELSVVDDQIGSPTFTGHLAAALVELAERASRPLGVLHCAAQGECSWHAFAEEIVRSAGLGTAVNPATTAEMGRPAARPAFSVLRSERTDGPGPLPDWRDGLSEYLSAKLVAR